jgi:hypothetical protein
VPETTPPLAHRRFGQPHRLSHLGHSLAGLQALAQYLSTLGRQARILVHVVPLADGSWLFGDISFALRSEGNNLLKHHS